jgi:signal transduction histidine kinase/PAS domain-containing protein
MLYGWLDVVHPDDRAHAQAAWVETMEKGVEYNVEYRIRRREGGYAHVVSRAVPVRRPDGAVLELIGTLQDVSEQRQAEAALRTAEERLRVALTSARMVAWDWDLATNQVVCSDNDYQWWQAHSGPAEQFFANLHPDDRSAVQQASERAIAGNGRYFIEYRILGTQGEIHWLNSRGKVHYGPDGQAQRIVGISTPITRRKHAELNQQFWAELDTRIRPLLDPDEIMQATSSALGVYLGVDHCYFAQIDDEAQRSTVHHDWWSSRAYSVAGTHEFALLLPPPLRQVYEAGQVVVVQDVTADPRTAASAIHYAAMNIHAFVAAPYVQDGRWLAALVVQMQEPRAWRSDELDLVNTIVVRVWPLVERAHLYATLEERVRERTAELERNNQELDQFAYVASHDLKAPLRAISHLVTWISEESASVLSPTAQDYLERVRNRVQRMARMLDDILDYSRVGRQHHSVELVETAALIHDVVEMCAPPPEFLVTVEGSLPAFRTERAPLETVFRNLIGNALKHHDRLPAGHVWISAQDQDTFLKFSVADDGPGIDEQFHERIFGMFQTLKPRDRVEGSGMGLAIVKKTVESRGGAVWVASRPLRGATFYFTWPKKPSAA